MSNLLTSHPVALQALMTEVLFSFKEEEPTLKVEVDNSSARAENREAKQVGSEEKIDKTFVYQGNMDKGILFILRYQEYPYFSPQADDAFMKIMKAIGLSKEEVALVNLAHPDNPNEFKQIMEFFSPQKIILLGVDPKSLRLPEIQHNSYMRGRIAVVFNTFSFEEMFDDLDKKRAFWNEFKNFMQS